MTEFYVDPADGYDAAPSQNPINHSKRRPTPRWIVAKSRTDNKLQRLQNDCTEFKYHLVITKAKELIASFGGDMVFERNYQNDPNSYISMHVFMTSSFYWALSCELAYNYKAFYGFYNCPYEEELLQIIRTYPLCETAFPCNFRQGFEAVHQVVFAESPDHVTAIKGQQG